MENKSSNSKRLVEGAAFGGVDTGDELIPKSWSPNKRSSALLDGGATDEGGDGATWDDDIISSKDSIGEACWVVAGVDGPAGVTGLAVGAALALVVLLGGFGFFFGPVGSSGDSTVLNKAVANFSFFCCSSDWAIALGSGARALGVGACAGEAGCSTATGEVNGELDTNDGLSISS